VTLQFGASLTDGDSSVNYDRNMFIIQALRPKPMLSPRANVIIQFHDNLLLFYNNTDIMYYKALFPW
jgi:hypothetical protein